MYEILEIKKGDEIQAAWPIVYHKSDRAKHVCMPALTQKLGILFAPSDAKPVEAQSKNQKLTTELMEQLGDTASFRQNFHENFTDWLPFYWRGYTQTTRYTYILEDMSDLNVLWNNVRQKAKTEIRKAQKLGIHIKDDLDLAQFSRRDPQNICTSKQNSFGERRICLSLRCSLFQECRAQDICGRGFSGKSTCCGVRYLGR